MSEHQYEIEIKSLLGSREAAERLLEGMRKYDPEVKHVGGGSQKNHYFMGGDREEIRKAMTPLLVSEEEKEKLASMLEKAQEISVRTREADGEARFVLKASVDDTTSENGTARMELESPVSVSLEELDEALLASGCEIQAKWSREREEYALSDGTNVCLDRNAGYGYLAEFERIVADAEEVDAAKDELRALMKTLGVEELPQDRLARMFEHYNANWRDYYGTEKMFTVE